MTAFPRLFAPAKLRGKTLRIRKVCGKDFIIGLSVSDELDVPVALQREALAEIVELHDRAGDIDCVTCGVGSYFDFYNIMPSGQPPGWIIA